MIWDTLVKLLAAFGVAFYLLVIGVMLLTKKHKVGNPTWWKPFWRKYRRKDDGKYTADVPPGGP